MSKPIFSFPAGMVYGIIEFGWTSNMQKEDIENLANRLMARHGVTNYSFRIHRLFDIAGPHYENIAITDPYKNVIALNELYVHLPDNEINLVLLHEIAHAITITKRGLFHLPHGPEWQEQCLAIGGDGIATWEHKSDILTAAINDYLRNYEND